MAEDLGLPRAASGPRAVQGQMEVLDTSCRKCGAEMRPLGRESGSSIIAAAMRVTGYLCECGHWNNLKRRKGWH